MMFCKKCGYKLQQGDMFCRNCGCEINSNVRECVVSETNTKNILLDEFAIVKFFKNYIRKPLSYFTDYVGRDSIKVSVPLAILLLILYGVIRIIYSKCLVKSIIGSIKNIPKILAGLNIISNADAIIMNKQLVTSNSWIQVEKTFSDLIDSKEVFFRGVNDLSILMTITIIVILILNATIIKNKLKLRDILLVSISSYIPLVVSFVIAAIGTLISILFGVCLIVSGYTLSCVTLYNGIKDMSGETKDKVFLIMIILFIIISAVVSFITITRFNNSIIQIGKVLNVIKILF